MSSIGQTYLLWVRLRPDLPDMICLRFDLNIEEFDLLLLSYLGSDLLVKSLICCCWFV